MRQLFPDQIETENAVLKCFAEGLRRVIMCSPTGSGKTYTFSHVALRSVQRGKIPMVVCHRDELISGASEDMKAWGLFPFAITEGVTDIPPALCYVASIATLRKRKLPYIDLLIPDEAHRCDFDKLIDDYVAFCNPYVIGPTASPIRTGNQRCLSTLYQHIVEIVTVSELLRIGRLCPARYTVIKRDFSNVKKTGAGEYNERAISAEFNKGHMYSGMFETWDEKAKGTKTLIFNSNIENSKITEAKFRNEGYNCVHVDGKTPTWKRREILKDFKRTPDMIVTNVDLFTTGTNEPSIETGVLNLATLSLAKYLQMIGRLARVNEGKPFFRSIDMGSNAHVHGLWHWDRTWTLKKKRVAKSDGVSAIKICSDCQTINRASAKKCENCGVVFKVEVKELKRGEFIEMSSEDEIEFAKNFDARKANLKELHKYAKIKGCAPGWAYVQNKMNEGKYNSSGISRGAKKF